MNNMVNRRVKKLLQETLMEYGRYIFGFLAFAIIAPIVLHFLFGTRVTVLNITYTGNFNDINIEGIFNSASFGLFAGFIFIAGIVEGYELPQAVRMGISRKEYFTVATVAAVIVSLLIKPLLLLINLIINSFVTSESFFYRAFSIGHAGISTLSVQFLIYIMLFLFGLFIAVLWQRIGWQLGVVITIAFLLISSVLGWSMVSGFNILTVTTNEYWFKFEWSLSNGLMGAVAMILIAILGMGTYALIKNVSVKAH